MAIFLLFIQFLISAQSNVFVSCHDGDTCTFILDGTKKKIRLFGIDAPEKGQPFWTQSRDRLIHLIKENKVRLSCSGRSYKRKVCSIHAGERDIQQILVEEGLAFDYPEYSNRKYQQHEDRAKAKKLGIWQQTKIISPYCKRKKKYHCIDNPSYMP